MNWMTSAKKRIYKSRKQRENDARMNAKLKLPPASGIFQQRYQQLKPISNVGGENRTMQKKNDHDGKEVCS